MSSSNRTATVLGFGGRAPSVILEILSKAVQQFGFTTIKPIRSHATELALLQAPYRTFLETNQQTLLHSKNAEPDLLLYCIPSSYAEYCMNQDEVTHVRSVLLDSSNLSTSITRQAIVILYNPFDDSIAGHTSADTVLQALAGDVHCCQAFACESLKALANLDIASSTQLGPFRKKDVVIVVGSGGREHAIAVALAQSPLVGQVVCCPGNGGTATEGSKIANMGSGQDNATVLELTKAIGASMVVVGPEQPLVDGLVNVLTKECPTVLVFGPTKEAAQLEASKAFTKDFLQQHNIPTAKYRTFTNADEAISYVESLDVEHDRQVVKASGLAAGKGVLLPTTKEETILAVKTIMSDKAFGDAGDCCVIESFMSGPEASCLAFCDGKTAKLMPAAQDHKRALDNDEGLNTGGMGAYAPAPCVTPNLHNEIEAMCIKTVKEMSERGTPYVGVLYAGMMLTPNGPSVLEFNCRFGDPETQVILPLLETDLYEVMTACCTGTLDSIDVRFKESLTAVTVVCAAKGYPETYPKGMEIFGLEAASTIEGVKVYHAGTKLDDTGKILCNGGRILAVTGISKQLKSAVLRAYSGVRELDFIDTLTQSSLMHFRSDIGKRAMQKKLRIGVLGSTRGTALLPVIEACTNGVIPAEIVAVVSNKESAPILDKGRALAETVLVKSIKAKNLTREQFDAECTAALIGAGVDFVLLVGYMRILSKSFTDFWKGKCVNVHPSLLPKHAGGMDLAVHQAVIDAKDVESGCTIHFVTEEVDGGPIVIQKKVHVSPDDTAESLKAKVQSLEGPAFVEAIQKYCEREVIGYADAGVSIDAGNHLVKLISPMCKATRRPGCEADLGGFGGLFDLAAAGYDSSDTVLIGATDGVGTKLKIAITTKKHETVGIDLVAMCVNDLIVAGGEPLFFLDYFASGHLEVNKAAAVVKGIAEGCQQAGCGLIGGETAEMPSMYNAGDFDLAGFAVGAVHRDRILPKDVCEGDILLGLASSGIHSNGFSLVRKLIERENLTYDNPCPWDPSSNLSIGDFLLTPTKIYVKSCLPLIQKELLQGLAHITGGGLLENLPRSYPPHLSAKITYHPPLQPVFRWMKDVSGLNDTEMLRTFNCGIGMVLILKKENVGKVCDILCEIGESQVYEIGVLAKGSHDVQMMVPLE